MTPHPLMITGLVTSAAAVAGIVAAVMREVRLFEDFREIAPQVKTIANQLRAEVFRDRHDLVVSGEYKGIPTVLRFCKQRNAPAMGLYVRIPLGCHLSLIPKQIAGGSRTSDVNLKGGVFKDCFVARSANPADLESLLAVDEVVKRLEALCCSGKTIVELNRGRLELLEMALPEELARHVLGQLVTIRELADVLATMPESERVPIRPWKREHHSWLFKVAVAAGIAVVAMSVIAATREHKISEVFAATDGELVHGVPTSDANSITGMEFWRAAKPDEVNAQFANWLQDSGQKPETRVEFKPVVGGSRGVAYLLVREDGARRLVVLVDHRAVFDACFSRIDGIALVPVTSFPKLKWGQWQTPSQKPNGDAILVVRDATDPRSAELLFFPNGTLFSGVPKDYSTIDLQRQQ